MQNALMKFSTREQVSAFVEDAYFGRVAERDIAAVMACFTPDAQVIIRHGDNPTRRFALQPTAETDDLTKFYAHLCTNYQPWFGDFEHVIDLGVQRSACYFTVRLTPAVSGLYADADTQTLRNCNFFEYAEGLIQHMIIFYSNAAAGAGAPTGYPQNQSDKHA